MNDFDDFDDIVNIGSDSDFDLESSLDDEFIFDPINEELIDAIQSNDISLIKNLILQGADPTIGLQEVSSSFKRNVAFIDIKKAFNLIKMFIKMGGDPNKIINDIASYQSDGFLFDVNTVNTRRHDIHVGEILKYLLLLPEVNVQSDLNLSHYCFDYLINTHNNNYKNLLLFLKLYRSWGYKQHFHDPNLKQLLDTIKKLSEKHHVVRHKLFKNMPLDIVGMVENYY